MAGAVPALLEPVPMDDASDMRAGRTALGDRPVFGAIDGVLGEAATKNRALARLDLVDAVDLALAQILAEIGDDRPLALTYSPRVSPVLGLRAGSNR